MGPGAMRRMSRRDWRGSPPGRYAPGPGPPLTRIHDHTRKQTLVWKTRARLLVPLAARPTVKQAMYAVARLGGHFKQNGDPGWQTLGRGLQRLLQAEQDALALQGLLRNQ